MSTSVAADWEVVFDRGALPDVPAIAARCRKKVTRRALLAAGVALVPVPGLDWLTDIGVLMRLLPEISAEFGLSEAQIERLAPHHRVIVYKAISAAGGMLIGRVVTHELVLFLVRKAGLRLSAQQVAKFVPVVGQAIAAGLSFTALRYVCEQHIRQCMAVAQQLRLASPPPA
jgi:uncharacterized protein (DUF697 family)